MNDYNLLKQQLADQQRTANQNLAQRMANAPMSVQNRMDMAQQGVQGSIGQAEQNYNTQQGFMNNQFGLMNQANQANIQANQLGNQATEETNAENRKYNIYYSLWKSGKMTSNQFRKLTGIDVKSYKKAKPKIDPDDFFNDPEKRKSSVDDTTSRYTDEETRKAEFKYTNGY